jgi:two-component system chemotaxis sensor kinase CheA
MTQQVDAHDAAVAASPALSQPSEATVYAFLEAVPVGVFVIRPNGVPYYANKRAVALLGKGISPDPSDDAELAQSYQAFVAGTDTPYPMQDMPIVRALGGAPHRVEDMVLRHPGRDIPLQVWASPVFDPEGRLEFAIAAFEDITERKRAEAEIAAAHAEVARRSAEMRLLLDHVDQGFCTVGPDGRLVGERSAAFDRWLGVPSPEASIWSVVAPHDPRAASWLEVGWSTVFDDVLPTEVAIAQLPSRLVVGERHLALRYVPIREAAGARPTVRENGSHGACLETTDAAVPVARVLVSVSDVTADVERERAESKQRELVAIFDRLVRDRAGFMEFFAEASAIVGRLRHAPPGNVAEWKRAVHTLKGTSALFGLGSVAAACHEVEDAIDEQGTAPTPADIARIEAAWRPIADCVQRMAGDVARARIEIDPEEHRSVVRSLRAEPALLPLAERVLSWRHEPTLRRLERFAEQARSLAQRLARGEIEVRVDDHGLKVAPEHWAGFWAAFSHVVRNAVDHGLEVPHERRERGKPERGQLSLSTYVDGDDVVVSIADDGRGIDWEAVRARAAERGLPHATAADLERALFVDGLSTRSDVTETSGRGVGMGAVLAACRALGGRVEVESQPGRGTCFRFRVPRSVMHAPPGAPPSTLIPPATAPAADAEE